MYTNAHERLNGGAGGIRTLDTLLAYTHFPGERLRPLGHRSAYRLIVSWEAGGVDQAINQIALDGAALEAGRPIGKVARRRRPPLWRTDGG